MHTIVLLFIPRDAYSSIATYKVFSRYSQTHMLSHFCYIDKIQYLVEPVDCIYLTTQSVSINLSHKSKYKNKKSEIDMDVQHQIYGMLAHPCTILQ